MEKHMDKLEKVKILQNGQEIDAYINIAEKIYADVWGEYPEKGKVTITAELLNSDKQPIGYKQVVTEYDGERRAMEISQKLQQKRNDDEEIMKFEEAREQKLVDNLPKFYQMLDEIMKDNENGTIKES